MSKITPKNLSYDSTLPPFLQRLQNAHASSQLDGRHEHAIARPKRARNADDEDEDAPAYIDEATNRTLSKEEYVALAGTGDGTTDADAQGVAAEADRGKDGKRNDEAHDGGEVERPAVKERVAGIGAAKKRKTGRVIGAADETAPESAILQSLRKEVATTVKETSRDKPKAATSAAVASASMPANAKGKKKTAKKMTLSFGDDADGG